MQLLSGFVGTSGGFAGLVLPLSKCLVNRDSESDRVFLGEGISFVDRESLSWARLSKDYTLQGCPNLAHDKLSISTKDIPSPRKTRSVSESRFTRNFDNGKTRPAKPPDAPTNPDRSCTYLVLRATPDETSYE